MPSKVKTTVPKSNIKSAVKATIRQKLQPGARQQIPWDKIESVYRKGKSSVEDIGNQFGVNPATIKWHAGTNKWKRETRAR